MEKRARPKRIDYIEATIAPLIATLIAFGVQALLPKGNISLVYLTAVLFVAVRTRTRPALLCAVIGFLAYNFFFTEPHFTLFMMHREDMLTVGFFLLMAAITGRMAARQREQFTALREREAVNRAQFRLSERLSAAIDKQEIGEALRDALTAVVAEDCYVFSVEHEGGEDRLTPLCGEPRLPQPQEDAARRALKDGQEASVEIDNTLYHFEPVYNQNRPVVLLILTFRSQPTSDLTESKTLISALGQQASLALGRTDLVDELQRERIQKERELLRSALLSSISHDLRSPLSAMIGSTTSLIDLAESLDSNQQRELLNAVLDEARRLDRYIQNLLDMTRLGYDGLRLDRDWIGLDEIIHVTLKRIQPLARGHTIERHLPADLPPLHVHAALIEQAIFNVLENAVKFSADNTTVIIEARRAGDTIQVDISDQGPGIPEDQRQAVFDMFFTGPQADRRGSGSGLGLAICQGVINTHRGSVAALDGPNGTGLTVRLTLPVVPYGQTDDRPEAVE